METSLEEYLSRLSEKYGENWKEVIKEELLVPLDAAWKDVEDQDICMWKALWAYLSLDGINWRHGVSRYGMITDAAIGATWASALLDILLGDDTEEEEIHRRLAQAAPHVFDGLSLEEKLNELSVGVSEQKERVILEYHTYLVKDTLTQETMARYRAAVCFVYHALKKRVDMEQVEKKSKHVFDELGPTTALLAPVQEVVADTRSSVISEGISPSDFDIARLILHKVGMLLYSGDKQSPNSRYLLVIDAGINLLPPFPSKREVEALRKEAREAEERRMKREQEEGIGALEKAQVKKGELLLERKELDVRIRETEHEIKLLKKENILRKIKANKEERELLEEELKRLS